jgi:hypothetical protein
MMKREITRFKKEIIEQSGLMLYMEKMAPYCKSHTARIKADWTTRRAFGVNNVQNKSRV